MKLRIRMPIYADEQCGCREKKITAKQDYGLKDGFSSQNLRFVNFLSLSVKTKLMACYFNIIKKETKNLAHKLT